MEITTQALRRISLFASLSDDALQSISRAAIGRTFAAGEIIIIEGDPCQAVYFIIDGEVRVYRTSPSGRDQVLAQLGAGKAFNTVPSFRPQSVNHATVQALAPVTVITISNKEFHHLLAEWPDLTLALLGDFAARLDQLTNLVEDLSLRTVRARLARFLLEYVDPESTAQRWTQEEIAAHLGTVRDMVGRALRAFADQGLLRIERQRIVLLDREGLEVEGR